MNIKDFYGRCSDTFVSQCSFSVKRVSASRYPSRVALRPLVVFPPRRGQLKLTAAINPTHGNFASSGDVISAEAFRLWTRNNLNVID